MGNSVLSKTICNNDFQNIFEEHCSKELETVNPSQVRIYNLNVINNAFSFDALHEYLLDIIGSYVFSRARIDGFYESRKEKVVAAKALTLLRKSANFDVVWLGEELGDVLLYVFLEEVLSAPKLFSKIELCKNGNQNVISSGSVHLLSLQEDSLSYQIVFGKSNIVGDLRDAIDAAFVKIADTIKNISRERQLVETAVLSQTFEKEKAKQLKEIILPSKVSAPPTDIAFGVFLGYTLGLKVEGYTNADFRKALHEKMQVDIDKHITYITEQIKKMGLSTYSFYFYVLPFNDAPAEKQKIMNVLLGGDSDE